MGYRYTAMHALSSKPDQGRTQGRRSQPGRARAPSRDDPVRRSEAGVAELNPRLDTLDRAVAATGQRLEISLASSFGLDETLIAEGLRLEPADRLRRFVADYASARRLSEAGKRALGS